MRLNLIAVSLLALSLSMPAMAADLVIDESGETGTAGTNGDNGTYGGNGLARVIQTDDDLIGNKGGDGGRGADGQDDATNGGGGGTIATATTAPVTGDVVLSADGGDGGAGGRGGNGGAGGFGGKATTQEGDATGGAGGNGGEAGHGGNGANGGAGGVIVLAVDHAVSGDIVLSASGGDAGPAGRGGNGGDGGIGGEGDSLAGGTERRGGGGDGGDGHRGGRADGPGGSLGFSSPSFYAGDAGTAGAGGVITVALSAAVGGGLTADAGTGAISVTLNTGAALGDTIAVNEAATTVLRFAMEARNKAEYRKAQAYLGSSANIFSGSIEIGGQTYSWTGFDALVEALTYAETIARSTSEKSGGTPDYVRCTSRAVTAFVKDGVIQLIAARDSGRGAFRIGTVLGQSFASQNDLGWTVRFDANGSFTVLDATGLALATCNA